MVCAKQRTYLVCWLGPRPQPARLSFVGWGPDPNQPVSRLLVGAPTPTSPSLVCWLGPRPQPARLSFVGWAPTPTSRHGSCDVCMPRCFDRPFSDSERHFRTEAFQATMRANPAYRRESRIYTSIDKPMTISERPSRIPGFYDKSLGDRVQTIAGLSQLAPEHVAALDGTGGLTPEQANHMIENVVGIHALPLGVAVNFLI